MMKKSAQELEAEMLAAMERRELKEIPPITTEKAETMRGLTSLVSVTDEVQVVEPAAIRTHWATEGDDEELNDLVAWRAAQPEIETFDLLKKWLDTDYDVLTDEQKALVEKYWNYVNGHKDLAVKPREDTLKRMATLMKEQIGEAELKNRVKKVHFMGYDKHGSKGEGVYCSCGMFKLHKRGKVLAAWADKHFEKDGHYWKRS